MARIRFDKLLDYWTPQMRRAFFQAIQNVRSLSQIGQLERAIAAGDVEAALRAIDLNPVNFRPIDSTVYSAFEAGGNATAAGFPTLGIPGGLRVVFQFNVRNPVAEQWLAQYSSNLITAIIDDQKQMIRQNLVRAMAAGTNPRSAALDLVGRIGPSGVREGGVVGLTQTQEQWVSNYGNALMSDNPRSALSYLMRDKRFDSSVINAAEGGEPLSADQIQSMMDSYANRALLYRGETIARTEMLTSLHESQRQAMQQAVDQGLIRKDAVANIWRTARDLRVRDSHAAMEGQRQPMDMPFVSGDGNLLMYPGDPSAPDEEVINCFPAGTMVQCEKVNLAYRRWFEGELVEIVTASGRRLSATKNHPILTPRGWVPVGELGEGDDVICGGTAQGWRSLSEPDVDDMPASIEQVFDALSVAGNAMRTCGSPVDFHGDGAYSNVDIVWAAGQLMQRHHVAAPTKQPEHFEFAFSDEIAGRRSAFSANAKIGDSAFLSPDGVMGARDLMPARGSRHLGPLQSLSGRLVPNWNAPVGEDGPHAITADREAPRGGDLGMPGDVVRDDLVRNSLALDGPLYYESVALVSRRDFSGHVYNLETKLGSYIANGIIVGNCRCWLESDTDFLAGVT